ncbi:MAG: nuclear transport factor 2 family protein [Planctomycetota bacterium]|jgi:predicted esterase
MRKAPLIPLLAVLLSIAMPAQTSPHTYESIELPAGGRLEYALVLPAGFDPERAYPLLLALPPGAQTREMVEASMRRYWGEQARRRNWIVVSPVAKDGQLFFRGGEAHIPTLLRHLRIQYRIDGNRMHLAGSSNGGRSAFRIATEHPYQFQSLVVLPGFPPADRDRASLPDLSHLAIRMFAGEEDTRWVNAMQETLAELESLNMDVQAQVLTGEGHVPASLDGDVIMNLLVDLHVSEDGNSAAAEAARVLDDFHDAACKADEARYFGHFSKEALFFGTAPEERWTLAQFQAYAESAFQRDSAWIYVPQERHLEVSPGGQVAWFDEVLVNAKYGVCRGTGVLRLVDQVWKVSQYNLSVPVPNELLPGVAEEIREHHNKSKESR